MRQLDEVGKADEMLPLSTLDDLILLGGLKRPQPAMCGHIDSIAGASSRRPGSVGAG